MKIILDTNFIISCINQKIDFLHELRELLPLAEIAVPEQVLLELEKLKENKNLNLKERQTADLSLQVLRNTRKIKLEKKFVDRGLLIYAEENPDDYIATLDRQLKNKIENVVFIKGKNRLALRD